MSSADFARMPGESKEVVVGSMPVREKRPTVGLSPYSALKAEGHVTEPVVFVPRASGEKPAETATPLPDEDLQGSYST